MTHYRSIQKISKKSKKAGYIGMNAFAAKALHLPFRHRHPEHTIEVDPALDNKWRTRTIHHEETEEYFMKNRHYPYRRAHRLANKFEWKRMPFPSKNIKRILKKIGLVKRYVKKKPKNKKSRY